MKLLAPGTDIVLCCLLLLFFDSEVYAKCTQQNEKRLKWVLATNKELKSYLYPEELCVIAAISNHLDSSSKNKNGSIVSSHIIIDPNQCHAGSSMNLSWNNLINSEKAVGCSIAGVDYYCTSRQPGRFQNQVEYEDDNHLNRCGAFIQDRFSYFSSHFANLVPSRQGPTVPHALSLFNTLIELNYQHFPILGDSIARQLFYALRGTWARSMTYANDSALNMRVGNYIPCGLKKISKATRHPLECLTADPTKCTDNNQATFLRDYTIRVIANAGASKTVEVALGTLTEDSVSDSSLMMSSSDTTWNRTLMILHPFGVHIWDVDVKIANGVARGIIEAGKAALARNSTLLVLESPAQHFVYDVDQNGQPVGTGWNNNVESDSMNVNNGHHGDYHSGVFQPGVPFFRQFKVPGPCCQKTTAGKAGNFRNVALLAALNRADPKWRNYVGWIPFYHISQQVYNGHVDLFADCTHFIYSPAFFDPLWQSIEYEVMRLQP